MFSNFYNYPVLRIYSQSSNGVESDHAETRAIYFEEKIYSKRKIIDFISILKGFRTSVKIMEKIQSTINSKTFFYRT